jgi:hypothetical protein
MRIGFTFVVLGALVGAAGSVAAHHSVLPYDGTTPATIRGTVTRVLWQNPHTYISIDVRGKEGVERWVIESEAAAVLARLGWTKAFLPAGTLVTVTGARARDGRTRMRCAVIEVPTGGRWPCFQSTLGIQDH